MTKEERYAGLMPQVRGVCEGEEVVGVLDIDSRELATFDEVDARWLEQVAACVATR